MLKTIEGVYSQGRVELAEAPEELETSRVLVTLLPDQASHQLSDYGIGEAQAADLRARFKSFEEDWNRPDMDGYDALQPRGAEPPRSSSASPRLRGRGLF